jgi:hypothetical protein
VRAGGRGFVTCCVLRCSRRLLLVSYFGPLLVVLRSVSVLLLFSLGDQLLNGDFNPNDELLLKQPLGVRLVAELV